MKFYPRIVLFSLILFAGTGIIIEKIYHQFPSKSVNTNNYNIGFSYKLGYFLGHFIFIIIGSLLIVAGIAGLFYTFKNFKNKMGINK